MRTCRTMSLGHCKTFGVVVTPPARVSLNFMLRNAPIMPTMYTLASMKDYTLEKGLMYVEFVQKILKLKEILNCTEGYITVLMQ